METPEVDHFPEEDLDTRLEAFEKFPSLLIPHASPLNFFSSHSRPFDQAQKHFVELETHASVYLIAINP